MMRTFLKNIFKKHRLVKKAKMLREKCDSLCTIDDIVNTALGEKKFSLVQKRTEITKFAKMIESLKPKVVCDIGTAGGGTLQLFSRYAADDARIISIDIGNSDLRKAVYPHLVRPNQQLTVLNGSSYAQDTVEYVKSWLKGNQIDLLFIDGDHSYEGVSKDFHSYFPLVSDNGIIGFHDIVPDQEMLTGKKSEAYVGGVPIFWQEIKKKFANSSEFIDQSNQDGYGIGILLNA